MSQSMCRPDKNQNLTYPVTKRVNIVQIHTERGLADHLEELNNHGLLLTRLDLDALQKAMARHELRLV